MFLALLLALSVSGLELQAANPLQFPKSPEPELTPGSLCERPSTRRYAEGISYCERDVSSALKRQVMQQYDERFGYQVLQMNRAAFKIDHYIPLCMGGSNRPDNLWPQHESIYSYTDSIEAAACEKMATGRLRQVEAIEYIRRAKADASQASEILRVVQKI